MRLSSILPGLVHRGRKESSPTQGVLKNGSGVNFTGGTHKAEQTSCGLVLRKGENMSDDQAIRLRTLLTRETALRRAYLGSGAASFVLIPSFRDLQFNPVERRFHPRRTEEEFPHDSRLIEGTENADHIFRAA